MELQFYLLGSPLRAPPTPHPRFSQRQGHHSRQQRFQLYLEWGFWQSLDISTILTPSTVLVPHRHHVPLPLATLLTHKNQGTAGYIFYFSTAFPVSIFSPPTRQQPGGRCPTTTGSNSPGSLRVTRGWQPVRQPSESPSLGKALACGTQLCSPPPPSPPRQDAPSARNRFTTPCLALGPSLSAPGLSVSLLWRDGDRDRVSDCPLAAISIPNPTPMATRAASGLFSGWRPMQAGSSAQKPPWRSVGFSHGLPALGHAPSHSL